MCVCLVFLVYFFGRRGCARGLNIRCNIIRHLYNCIDSLFLMHCVLSKCIERIKVYYVANRSYSECGVVRNGSVVFIGLGRN